nr:immunoglobulin heavy chain junction region [Mus musculus]MBK4197332.1 immunoglobulin heavy chain junction region [Mus musculus]MBK4197333.1 immunoglobulin heavy chain junction region [Mus musculus]
CARGYSDYFDYW